MCVYNNSNTTPSLSAVRRGRRRQVGCCGVSLSGVRREASVGAEGMLAVLAGPMMSDVWAGRVEGLTTTSCALAARYSVNSRCICVYYDCG